MSFDRVARRAYLADEIEVDGDVPQAMFQPEWQAPHTGILHPLERVAPSALELPPSRAQLLFPMLQHPRRDTRFRIHGKERLQEMLAFGAITRGSRQPCIELLLSRPRDLVENPSRVGIGRVRCGSNQTFARQALKLPVDVADADALPRAIVVAFHQCVSVLRTAVSEQTEK
jgi:hypothetical protein